MTAHIEKMQTMTDYLLGHRFKGINTNVARVFSLYTFILHNLDTPIDVLQGKILENGKPLFTPEQLKQIVNVVRSQRNTPYARTIVGTRGGGVAGSLNDDPSRNKFWDRVIRKLAYPISSKLPESWNGVLWYAFFLYSLEQIDFIGPFLSTALDTITLSLPVMAEIVSEVAMQVIGFAPIPYAGKIGEAVGYGLSLMFVMFAIFINTSRKHFGSAFTSSLQAIPIIGDNLMSAAMSFETGSERYLRNRDRILQSVGKASPKAEAILDYYTPTTAVHEGPAPPIDLQGIKRNIADYAIRESGVGDMIDSATSTFDSASSNLARKANLGALAGKASAKFQQKASSAVLNGISKSLKKGGKWRRRRTLKQKK